MHSHNTIKIFLSASLKPHNPQVHIYGRARARVKVQFLFIEVVLLWCHVVCQHYLKFLLHFRFHPSCHDLSSKYEVRGGRPAPAQAASQVAVLMSLLIISDGSVIQ